MSIVLRPGITNPRLWYPKRPPDKEWRQIRQVVMERDDYTCAACGHHSEKWMNAHHLADSGNHSPENLAPLCIACHAVMHLGRSLMENQIEVWECEIEQVKVVTYTRRHVARGFSLTQIKARLPLKRGKYDPGSVDYANDLIKFMGNSPRAYLPEPLCAIFIHLPNWQIDTDYISSVTQNHPS